MRRLLVLVLLFVIGCSVPRIELTPEMKAEIQDASAYPLQFEVAKDTAETVWGRAQTWIASNSRLKIQIATDYVIQTYSPFEPFQKGYSVTRTPSPNGFIIEAVCSTYNPNDSTEVLFRDYFGHALARYMQIGR